MKLKLIIYFWVLLVFSLTILTSENKVIAQSNTLTDSDALIYYSNPSNHINKDVNFTGKILKLLPSASGTLGLQMYQAGDLNRNTIIIYKTPIQLFKDDCIRVTGISQPVTEYQNMFGATLSAAAISANSIVKIDCAESIEPAIKTVIVEETKMIDNINMTLHKIEFSNENTRAYLTIENDDEFDDITFLDYNSIAIQGKSQFVTTNSYSVEYPKIVSTIPPGIQEEGAILFEPLDPNKTKAQFRFEVNKDNENIKFIFDVIVLPLEHTDSLLFSNPDDIVALVNKGVALSEMGNYIEAIKYYDMALALDPNDDLTLRNKGSVLQKLGNHTGAIKYYDMALALDPIDPKTNYGKGSALYYLGNSTGAIKYFKKALELDPHYISAMIDLAHTSSDLGNYTGAD